MVNGELTYKIGAPRGRRREASDGFSYSRRRANQESPVLGVGLLRRLSVPGSSPKSGKSEFGQEFKQ